MVLDDSGGYSSSNRFGWFGSLCYILKNYLRLVNDTYESQCVNRVWHSIGGSLLPAANIF